MPAATATATATTKRRNPSRVLNEVGGKAGEVWVQAGRPRINGSCCCYLGFACSALCSTHTHTLTHMRIYKSLLNLQGTFMQLLFDMVASFLIHSIHAALHKIDNDYVNMPHQEGSLSMCVCLSVCFVCLREFVTLCAGFQFKWTCRRAFYFLTHSIIFSLALFCVCERVF